MRKILIVIFNDEKSADNGLVELTDLHVQGIITLYEYVMVIKNDKGEISTTKEVHNEDSVGTIFGMLTGTIIGLLGGPVGMLAGMTIGTLSGAIYDLKNAGVDAAFVEDISNTLSVGKTMIIADIDEEKISPVDTAMFEHGGIVFRRLRTDIEDEQIQREVDTAKKNIKHLLEELEESPKEMRKNIQKHIDSEKEKIQLLLNRADKKIDDLTKEFENNMDILRIQRNQAIEQNQAMIDQKMNILKKEYDRTKEKYKCAYTTAKKELEL